MPVPAEGNQRSVRSQFGDGKSAVICDAGNETLSSPPLPRSPRGLTSSYTRIRRIHVKAQMYRPLPLGVHMRERHLDHFPDPVLVDVVHGEALDIILAQNTFFGRVDVPEADVDAVVAEAKSSEGEKRCMKRRRVRSA